MSNETTHAPADARERAAEPTQAQIDDACMWYRHDFGLLDDEEREHMRSQARAWFGAWGKALSNGDDPAALLRTPRGEGEPVAYMVTASRHSGGGVEWVGDWLFRGPAECEEHVRWLHRPQSRWQDVRVTPLYAARTNGGSDHG